MILLTEQHMPLFRLIPGLEWNKGFAIRFFKELEKWFPPIRVVFLKCEACLQGLRWGWEGEVSWFIWFSTRGGGGCWSNKCVSVACACVYVCAEGGLAQSSDDVYNDLSWTPFINTATTCYESILLLFGCLFLSVPLSHRVLCFYIMHQVVLFISLKMKIWTLCDLFSIK